MLIIAPEYVYPAPRRLQGPPRPPKQAERKPLAEGDWVSYHTGNAWRSVRVLATPRPGSKTVLVSGFRYKHGGMAKPRRVPIVFIK
jgi:hypothetical protein